MPAPCVLSHHRGRWRRQSTPQRPLIRQQVQRFFSERHAGKYRIYNICSERHYPADKFEASSHRFRFDDHNPCRLELMEPMCKDIHDWLTQDEENVVAIHCKAGKGRTGLVISTYLVHAGYAIMPNATKIDIPNANAALELFGRQRTSNGKGVTIPSQMRYVHYYERIKAEGGPRPMKRFRLLKVRLITTPNFDVGGGCDPYFHIKMQADDSWSKGGQLCFGDLKTGGKKIFDWSDKAYGGKIRHYKRGEPFIDLNCGLTDLKRPPPLLMGDVKFVFYDHDRIGSDEEMFHFWFNTAYVEKNYLRFQKPVLDRACKVSGRWRVCVCGGRGLKEWWARRFRCLAGCLQNRMMIMCTTMRLRLN